MRTVNSDAHLKGQVEVIAIVGIIVVAAVVVILSTQVAEPPSFVPLDVQQDHQAIKNFLATVATGSTEDTLKLVEGHGGYLTVGLLGDEAEVVPFTLFLDDSNGVPLWQQCGDTEIPPKSLVNDLIGIAVTRHILDRVSEVQSLSGKPVVVDTNALRVTTAILDGRIQTAVELPVSVDGYPIEQPAAVVNVPTQLSEIYDFASDFAEEMANTRAFEIFTRNAILHSRTLPTVGVLTDCGTDDDIHLTGQLVDEGLMRAVRSAKSPSLWTSMVDQTAGSGLENEPKIYAIESVNGNHYPDLEVRFDLPLEYEITGSDPINFENPEVVARVPGLEAEGLETTDVCLAVYNQVYSVAYPVVVSVFDEDTKQWFRFASFVHLDVGPAGSVADGQGIVDGIVGSIDQSLQESGYTRGEFQSQLEDGGL